MKLIAYNKIYDYDFITIYNGKVMLFKYSARFRIKKDLQKEIFLNDKVVRSIDTINKHLDMWQVVATCVEKVGVVDYYKIITCDRYLKNQKILDKKNKYLTSDMPFYNKDVKIDTSDTLDLSDLD